eukprot:XP_011415016.1 PREDICTED: uncharacterized protein LOC105319257 [Crassostrea gigas]
MLHNFFRTCFLINLLISDSTQWVNLYGEKTATYPKSTCSEIPYDVLSAASCFQRCLGTLRIHYMFSYSKDQHTCMCCADLSGDDLVSPQWISFVPVSCKDGYLTYNYTNTQICLKYVSTPCTYPEATGYCQADGGDLIRLDSQLKHEIATDYLLPIANGSTIDVWIQGTKVGNDWFFHDGSKMPEDFDAICPLALDNNVNETHLRVHGSSTFPCWDMVPTRRYSFLCEQYRQFTIYE